MNDFQRKLVEQGCLWVCGFQKSVDDKKIDYSYGYCSKNDGRYELAVVVYYEKDFTLAQMQEAHQANYFVLVDEEERWRWYESELLTEIEAPMLHNQAMAFSEEAMMNMVILTLMRELECFDLTNEERQSLVRMGLLLHTYTAQSEEYTWAQCSNYVVAMEVWETCQIDYVLFDETVMNVLRKPIFEMIYRHISVLPVTSIELATSYYQLFHLERVDKSLLPLQMILEKFSLQGQVAMLDGGNGGRYLQLIKNNSSMSVHVNEDSYEQFKELKMVYLLAGQAHRISYASTNVLADHYIHLFAQEDGHDVSKWMKQAGMYYRQLQSDGGLLVLYPKCQLNVHHIAQEAGFEVVRVWDNLQDIRYQRWHAVYFKKGV